MSKADPTTDDSSTEIEEPTVDDEHNNPDDDYYWIVRDGDMFIGKAGYDTYELGFQSFSVTFEKVKEQDSDDEENTTYELRDGSYNTQGTFDPMSENVPERVTVAFEVLANEL